LESEKQAFGVQNLVYVTMMNRSYVRRYLSCVRSIIPLEVPCNDREKNQNGYQKGQNRQKGQKHQYRRSAMSFGMNGIALTAGQLKKMKNSHPQVPHVQQVPQVRRSGCPKGYPTIFYSLSPCGGLSEAKSIGVAKTSEVERSETHRAERSETHRAEKFFWQEIEAIKNEELPKLYPETEPLDLESQITNTIAGLKYLVTNGILPVKTITDTFNQNRSKESQLTYSRLGRLLSTMGFRKAKTPNGCSAILWDDQLLSQDTDTNAHNSLPENCLEEK